MDTKICKVCQEPRSLDQFNKHPTTRDGLQVQCRECCATLNRQRYEAKGEQIRAHRQAHCEADRNAINEYNRQNYYKLHSQRREGRKKEYAANPDLVRRREQLRRKQVVENGGSYTLEEWKSQCQECDYCCYLCGRKLSESTVVVEHMVPVSRGGRSDIGNLMPACRSCNAKKRSRTYDEYIAEMAKSLL